MDIYIRENITKQRNLDFIRKIEQKLGVCDLLILSGIWDQQHHKTNPSNNQLYISE